MDANRNISNGSQDTDEICPEKFEGTIHEWHLLTTAPLTIGSVNFFCSLVNLTIFCHWKPKSSYSCLFLSLTVCETLYAAAYTSAGLARIVDPHHTSKWPYIVTAGFTMIFSCLLTTHIALVTVDRWFTLEFAIFYRSLVASKAAKISIAVVWVVFLVFYAYVIAILHEDFLVPCAAPLRVAKPALWLLTSQNVGYWVAGFIIIVIQSRVAYIAVRARLKSSNNIHPTQHGVLADAGQENHASHSGKLSPSKVVQIFVRTVLGGYVMVAEVLLCQLPGNFMITFHYETTAAYVPGYLLLYVGHMFTVPIYFAFYREYRRSAKDILRRLLGRSKPRITIRRASTLKRAAVPANNLNCNRLSVTPF